MTFPEILEKHFPNQFIKKDIGKLQELVEFCLNLKLKEIEEKKEMENEEDKLNGVIDLFIKTFRVHTAKNAMALISNRMIQKTNELFSLKNDTISTVELYNIMNGKKTDN